jgi:hypothetical protein
VARRYRGLPDVTFIYRNKKYFLLSMIYKAEAIQAQTYVEKNMDTSCKCFLNIFLEAATQPKGQTVV